MQQEPVLLPHLWCFGMRKRNLPKLLSVQHKRGGKDVLHGRLLWISVKMSVVPEACFKKPREASTVQYMQTRVEEKGSRIPIFDIAAN